MPFYGPDWLPKLEHIPESISIEQFAFDEAHGRYTLGYSKDPFTCGLSGKSYPALEVKERVDFLSRAIAKELGFDPNKGTEWEKVVGIFSLNTIDYCTVAWALHRLGGIASCANAAYSADELAYQLKDSGVKACFTCLPLLEITIEACKKVGVPQERIYILELPKEFTGGKTAPAGFKTVDDLISAGTKLPKLDALKWSDGQGGRQCAFLCYSSGTSGLPKGVMISHRNVIANTLQISAFDSFWRDKMLPDGEVWTEVALGLLPFSHIYGLVVICHASIFRGDQIIVMPKFEMKTMLNAIQRYKIQALYLVPPILILLTKNRALCSQYDLTSARTLFTGAAPLGRETADDLQAQFPRLAIRQGYGLTETCTVVCSSSPHDIWLGSCGSLLPNIECKLLSIEGTEVTGYDQPGELCVKSPSVVLGYLHNDKANKETFQDGFMRTGDEAVFRKNPKSGYEHVYIVDRIKELIKVKGLQVAPAELEAHLLTHPAVADCAVIASPDDAAGEVPKAFVVKSNDVGIEDSDAMTRRSIMRHVEKTKARHKWLKGGVEFIDVVPKSPSGKILRRMLRDKEREKRRKEGAKM